MSYKRATAIILGREILTRLFFTRKCTFFRYSHFQNSRESFFHVFAVPYETRESPLWVDT